MANEIYNKTWWGDTAKTAFSLLFGYGDATRIGGQIDMYQRSLEEGATIESTLCAANKIHTDENIG